MNNVYKLRAECLLDWHRVCEHLAPFFESYEVTFLRLPDVEVEVKLKPEYNNIGHLQSAIVKVPDSHTMLATVEPLVSYTGERKF
jgi:hypothetical protein